MGGRGGGGELDCCFTLLFIILTEFVEFCGAYCGVGLLALFIKFCDGVNSNELFEDVVDDEADVEPDEIVLF